MRSSTTTRRRNLFRHLKLESLEPRLPLASDIDDALSEATWLGAISTSVVSVNADISPDTDVDMYRFAAAADQTVDFDIDTTMNGPGGLGSYLRLFNAAGTQLAWNNDAPAPGESALGFDAYLRYTFGTSGTYYLGVSNATNASYSAVTGNGDVSGGQYATGTYQLSVQALPVDTDDAMSEATALGTITTTAKTTSSTISTDIDVDMYRFTAAAGQVIDFDIDTVANGRGGLGSYLRLFNSTGQQLAYNNDANAPGENTIGFDAYLRYNFTTSGTYYLGVSNANNTLYNAVTGTNDWAGGLHSAGSYQLIVQALPVDTDDSIVEATAMGTISSTAATVNSNIATDIDVDLYKFSVVAGQTVDFDIDTATNGPGGLGSYLRLFNAQGTQLASNNDAAAPGENTVGFDAYLRYTFNSAGTYYLGVSNLNNILYSPATGNSDTAGGFNTVGAYQLNVQSPAVAYVDPDDTLAEATSLGAVTTTAKTVSSSISPDVDVDMYRFTVVAGQLIDFDIDTTLNGPGGLGSYLKLFDSLGNQLAYNNDAAAPGESNIGFDAYLRYQFTTPGTFYLGVSNANNTYYNPVTGVSDFVGGANATGNYTLNIQAVPIDPDDTLAKSTSLGVASTTASTISSTISTDVDVDMYRFTAVVGQVIDLDIDTALNGPGGLGSYLRLFNAQGQQLNYNNDGNAPGENRVGFDAYLRYSVPATGTYYVGISNANNNAYNPLTGESDYSGGLNTTGAYSITLQALPIDTNDSMGEAMLLGAITTTGSTVNASIGTDIDVNMYRFTVAAGQIVDFDIDTTLNGPGGLGSYLRLFNAAGQQINANNDAAAPDENLVGFDAYLRHAFAASGTYYLGVSNANNTLYDAVTGGNDFAGGFHSIGAYQLMVRTATIVPLDSDDTLNEATSLGAITSTGITASSTIDAYTDVDMYRFEITAGQTVDFDIDTTLNGPGGLGSYIRLFDNLGNELASNNDGAAPGENVTRFDAYLRYTFTTSGSYYLGVSDYTNIDYNAVLGTGDTSGGLPTTGSFQLTIKALPNDTDDTLSEATNLGAITTTSITASSTIVTDVDVDMYRFTVSAGAVVDFDIDTLQNGRDGLGSFLILFNASGQPLASNNDAAAPGESVVGFDAYLRYTFTSAGTYYVGISNANNVNYSPTTGNGDTAGGNFSIGSYDLRIQQVATSSTTFAIPGSSDPSSASGIELIWHNAANPYDVNNDGLVTPIDALLIVNYLNDSNASALPTGSLSTGSPPPYLDVDGSNTISPLDSMLVINYLNSMNTLPTSAEGEAGKAFAIATASSMTAADQLAATVTDSSSITNRSIDQYFASLDETWKLGARHRAEQNRVN